MSQWYSISLKFYGDDLRYLTYGLDNKSPFFTGYFKVNENDNIVEFYETIDGNTNFSQNILGATNIPKASNNKFFASRNAFSTDGVNIQSELLRTKFNTNSFHFNLHTPQNLNNTFFLESTGDFFVNPEGHIMLLANNPSCFNEGTKILCLNKNLEEEYIPIERLKKGDIVKSYKHGYRRIDVIYKNVMINEPDKFNHSMYLMKKTDDNGLLEDLIVTGGHSILVDDLGIYKEENDLIFGGIQMIDDKYLLLAAVSKDFVKLMTPRLYMYYHIILENNGNDNERFGVWANGILTETPPKQHFIDHIQVE